eukprot:m.352415 g.352415  ORF g.352415 m.352415 type:complete len:186 (+) comp58896_c0_seq1:151-708(+)
MAAVATVNRIMEEPKINKKIAQLTKVVYMLNSRCEDGDVHLAKAKEKYEREIQTILAHARKAIALFASALENAVPRETHDTTIKNLQEKLKDEIASYKKTTGQEMKRKVDDIARDYKLAFQERIREVAAMKETLRKHIEETNLKKDQKEAQSIRVEALQKELELAKRATDQAKVGSIILSLVKPE